MDSTPGHADELFRKFEPDAILEFIQNTRSDTNKYDITLNGRNAGDKWDNYFYRVISEIEFQTWKGMWTLYTNEVAGDALYTVYTDEQGDGKFYIITAVNGKRGKIIRLQTQAAIPSDIGEIIRSTSLRAEGRKKRAKGVASHIRGARPCGVSLIR